MIAYAPAEDGEEDVRAVRVHRATNIYASRKRFEIGRQGGPCARPTSSRARAGSSARFYHSHTHTAPYPSQTDINFAANWPGLEWVIVGLAGEEPEVALLHDRWRRTCARGRARGAVIERDDQIRLPPAVGREHPPSERFCAACGDAAGARLRRASSRPASDGAPRARSSPSTRRDRSSRSPRSAASRRPSSSRGLLLEEGIPSMVPPGRRPPTSRNSSPPGRATCSCPSPVLRRAREALAYERD